MTRMRAGLFAMLAACVPTLAGDYPLAGTHPLKPVTDTVAPDAWARGYLYPKADRDNEAEVPFASAAGRLRLRIVGGNKVLMDCNGDGKLDEADGEAVGVHTTVPVTVMLAGRPCPYPIYVSGLHRELASYCLALETRLHLEAQVGDKTLWLHDRNFTGRFGDMVEANAAQTWDLVQFGPKGALQAFGQCVVLAGALYECEVLNAGEALRLRPYAGPLATLALTAPAGWQVQVRVCHARSGLEAEAATGARVPLPVGEYRIKSLSAALEMQERDAKTGRRRQVRFVKSAFKQASLSLQPGDNALPFGPPFRLEFEAAKTTADTESLVLGDAWLVGASGEFYGVRDFGAGGSGERTLACSVRANGREQEIGSVNYG